MPITDDFNRASLGSDWEHVSGTAWTINASTTVRPGQVYTETALRRTEAAFPNDQYSQAKCEFTSGGDNSYGGVAVRLKMSGDGYEARFDSSAAVTLYKRVGGVVTYLSDYPGGYSANTFYTLKLTVTGNQLTVHVDGTLRISYTDTSITSGKPGLVAHTGEASLLCDFDDFESTVAEAAGAESNSTTVSSVVVLKAAAGGNGTPVGLLLALTKTS
jgi:hypothetical protein